MKQAFKLALVMLAAVAVMTACNKSEFKTTDSGLMYKFVEINKEAQQVQEGDVLVGICTIRLDDSVLMVAEQPDRLLTVTKSAFPGDLSEGLLMMHINDHAIFGVDADQMANLGVEFPPYYKQGTGMKVYYDITLTDIVTKAEIQQEQQNFMSAIAERDNEEKVILAQYAAENNIKVQPNEDGVYIVVKKLGKGPKVEIGREVAINYTGKLLNGNVFDTSVESVAKENGLYNPQRPYAPLSYTVGQMSLIQGWEEGVINQPEGTKLTIIMPSSMGYGPQPMGKIPANSPLVFDIDIVSVK